MTISQVAVVIPINNEEQLLDECLHAIEAAVHAYRSGPHEATVRVIGVLDACTDRSRSILNDWPSVDVITVDHRNVGKARAAGIQHAISTFSAFSGDLSHLWIANTDADSRVPATWLQQHLALAADDIDLVIGGIRPAPRDLTADQFSAWQYRDAAARRVIPRAQRVHGANLGFRADAYDRVGGFLPLTVGEDVDLVARLIGSGARSVVTSGVRVETSARTIGRMSGGYADFVRLNY